MARDDAPRQAGPTALSALFDDALKHLRTAQPAGDGFLFSGNRHESVPRALFLDRRLTPLERNAWQVFRLQLNDDGVTAFPTYDQLRPYLASMPCAAQASHETVARALTLLRLTRWLSLVRRRRDPKTGRIQGNLYVLHDEPLTPFEAMQLDPDYLGLVSQALTHAAKAVQVVGLNTLKEIAEDPLLSGRTLPTRLQVLAQRLAQQEKSLESYPQDDTDHDSEEVSHGPQGGKGDGLLDRLAQGRCVPAAGRARRMGRALRWECGPQSSCLSVRHHPESHPGGVPGLGRPARIFPGTPAAAATTEPSSAASPPAGKP